MFTDLLPALVLVGAAFLILFFALRAMRKRERYCGDNLKHCFWCGEDCEYYRLDKVSSEVTP